MTSATQLEARVCARMARTGERYAVARAHVVGAAVPAVAEELWRLRAEHADAPPFGDDRLAAVLAAMSGQLREIHAAETAAVTRLGAALPR